MEEVSIVGVDLAKQVFQVHGATADGRVLFRKKLSRSQFPKFMAGLRPCVVAMEACGTAHYWGREFASMGHDVRLILPVYVKAFVKRQKNDVADAEAVAEAAMRPTMRTVAVKTSEQQARAMLFRTRDLLVGQRTQMVNALRGRLAEHGIIVGKGLGNVERLATLIAADDLPELVRTMGRLYLNQITQLHEEIDQIDRRIAAEAKQSDIVRRLQKVPGIGLICAMAITAFAPPMEAFRSGRDFAAWLGLVPRQHSSGGKQKLGRTSKMGQRDIRKLLIIARCLLCIGRAEAVEDRVPGSRICWAESHACWWRLRWQTSCRGSSEQCFRAIKNTEIQAERSAEGRRSNWSAGDVRRT